MMSNVCYLSRRILNSLKYHQRVVAVSKCHFSDSLESKYSEAENDKILEVLNNSDISTLSSYDISKVTLKKFAAFRSRNEQIKTLSDIEYVEGLSERTAKKLFTCILSGIPAEKSISSKIKGQFLHPNLSSSVIKNCETVLSVYVTVNSVCWTLIDKKCYEVKEWKYYGIDYPEGKRLQITDILNTAWSITQQLPTADIYVMKAEATSLRAAGSDPNNPKVMAINLQKAQMISMMVALINARSHEQSIDDEERDILKQRVYFLRPSLPYRLYGTLVGNERVSTEQTVEMLLESLKTVSVNNSRAYVPEDLQEMFRSQKDLKKDMLGQCLLLSLTFMDLCIYKNQERIAKLLKRGEK